MAPEASRFKRFSGWMKKEKWILLFLLFFILFVIGLYFCSQAKKEKRLQSAATSTCQHEKGQYCKCGATKIPVLRRNKKPRAKPTPPVPKTFHSPAPPVPVATATPVPTPIAATAPAPQPQKNEVKVNGPDQTIVVKTRTRIVRDEEDSQPQEARRERSRENGRIYYDDDQPRQRPRAIFESYRTPDQYYEPAPRVEYYYQQYQQCPPRYQPYYSQVYGGGGRVYNPPQNYGGPQHGPTPGGGGPRGGPTGGPSGGPHHGPTPGRR